MCVMSQTRSALLRREADAARAAILAGFRVCHAPLLYAAARGWNAGRAPPLTSMPDERRAEHTTLADMIEARLSRRAALKGLAAFALLSTDRTRSARAVEALSSGDPGAASSLTFREIAHGSDERIAVAEGYDARVLISWGDKIFADSPAFDPLHQSPTAQGRQFGFNNDFIAFMPLPRGSRSSDRGLLCVNHEYTWMHMMLPGIAAADELSKSTQEQVDIEMAAHGHAVIEVKKVDGAWQTVTAGDLNRRITASTPMRISGPAAGHARLKTKGDPSGTQVLGTINNCAGGITPWGTVLTCEENFNKYFSGRTDDGQEARNHARYDVGGELEFAWHRHHARFDVSAEPHEPNRFGWVVEYDPYDPRSVPVKRTALGRIKHEGATCVLAPDQRLVVYTGDDDEFEFIYRFVSKKPCDPGDPKANADLLDEGRLYVARFSEGGQLTWLPLVHGDGPLTEENGFASQADVLIEARTAATLLGATRMDRPEDVETNPVSGHVFVMLTNNRLRKSEDIDAANPRAKNKHGHVVELIPPSASNGEKGALDHAATEFRWDIFLQAGDPREKKQGAVYDKAVSANGWLTCPDNCAFDKRGRLWITTDGAPKSGMCDGVYACDTIGPGRALTRFFFRGPRGSELTGPCFTPDGKTLFLSVQHPGETDDDDKSAGFSFSNPSTRWPDFKDGWPPRPSVVAVTKKDGGEIGS